jgi:hypothetical protein
LRKLPLRTLGGSRRRARAAEPDLFFNHKTHRKAAIEHWDGTSWSIVSSPNPTKSPGLDSSLRAIAAISASDIWAVGFNFTSLGGWDTLPEH